MFGSFWEFQAKDLLNAAILCVTIWAIIKGPVIAVKLTREAEVRDRAEQRKSEVFAAIMKTRRTRLDADHVAALNLIQVFFHSEQGVITRFKDYMRHLSRTVPPPGPEADVFIDERNDLFIELASEIGRSLGYTFDKKEINDLSYGPTGWINEQESARKLQTLLIELLENKRGLGVAPFVGSATKSPFPPPPNAASGRTQPTDI